MTLQEDILRILTQCKQEILANMDAKNVNASGRTAASLQIEQTKDGIKLFFAAGDRAPMETLEIGRPGGKVPRNFTDIIEEWSLEKGLNWGDEKTRRKIAGAVAWGRIRPHGTQRHRQPIDVYSTPAEKAKREAIAVAVQSFSTMIKTAANNFK